MDGFNLTNSPHKINSCNHHSSPIFSPFLFNSFLFFILCKIIWFDDRDGKNMPKGTFFSEGQKRANR
jgi:hypothetical protein